MSAPSHPLTPRRATLLVSLVLITALVVGEAGAIPGGSFPPRTTRVPDSVLRYRQAFLADRRPVQRLAPETFAPCVGGMAAGYPCKDVDLLAFMPLGTIGGGLGNDVWGWTDPLTGREYAIMGRSSGTSFVDISTPTDPVYVGNLPAHTSSSLWRDVESYGNFLVVVSEAFDHGMQVFDLRELRTVQNPPVTFSETAHYAGFGSAHTVAVDQDTGFAFANGSDTCGGGLHMVDVRTPTEPKFAGCYSGDGYSHDSYCVVYRGPDATYRGREICFASNEDTLTIVDVTNKSGPILVSRNAYPGSGYTHQGWLTRSQTIFAIDDELDEVEFSHNYWTRFWDVSDLDAPTIRAIYKSPTVPAIDHNLYITGGHVYESNYRAGLRILGRGGEIAYFDVFPEDDLPSFNGTWSNFPFYASGVVAVSGIEEGLFIVRPRLSTDSALDWLE